MACVRARVGNRAHVTLRPVFQSECATLAFGERRVSAGLQDVPSGYVKCQAAVQFLPKSLFNNEDVLTFIGFLMSFVLNKADALPLAAWGPTQWKRAAKKESSRPQRVTCFSSQEMPQVDLCYKVGAIKPFSTCTVCSLRSQNLMNVQFIKKVQI